MCLALIAGSSMLFAQFNITGRVVLGTTLEPVPDYEVNIYLPVHNQHYTVKTDGKGIYTAGFDWTSAEILQAVVQVVDFCTGAVQEVKLPGENGGYIANFQLCTGVNPPPPPPGCEAHFAYEQLEVKPPLVLFLDLSYNSDPETFYHWDFGDGSTSSEPAPTHEFPSTGVYQVSLTIESDSCSSTVSQTVLVLEKLDCVCPAVYNPVCVILPDSTVITFGNACEAACAGFKDATVTSCEPNDCNCPQFYDPVCVIGPDGDSLSFSNRCFAQCAGYGPDAVYSCNPINDCHCTNVYEPVCVVNDAGAVLNFPNACQAKCAGYPASAIVDCAINCICPEYYDPVCVVVNGDTLTFSNPCFAECAGYQPDQVFHCDVIDNCACPRIYDPVCVTTADGDSLQFDNACLAECAGYGPDQYQSCNPDSSCICPEYYSPVCVVVEGDTLSFANVCFAQCAGYGADQVFACNPNNACNCDAVYDPICAIGPDGTMIRFENRCVANCRGYADDQLFKCESDCICPAVYDPVCVIDDQGKKQVFGNRCEAYCAGYGDDRIFHCEPQSCDCPDVEEPVCVVVNGVTLTFGNRCRALCAGHPEEQIFSCEVTECNCPEIYSPVCVVTDFGPAYWFVNACEAQCAGFGPDAYESCGPENCVCPAVYDPVCAIGIQGDTILFGNTCEAICAGYKEDQLFKCDYGGGCNCDLIYDPVCVYTPGGTVLRFANPCEARCQGYDETVWVKCEDTYCRAQFRIDHVPDQPLSIQFYNRSQPMVDSATVWLWNFGDGTTSNEFSPLHQYAKEGVYEVSLTITTLEGCKDTYVEKIVVGGSYGSACQAMFFFEQDPTDPYHFRFHDKSLGHIVAWQWYFGDGTTSTEAAPEHVYVQAGIYIVSLSVTTADGCTDLVSILVATADDIVYNPDCHALFLPVIVPDSNQVFFLNFSTAGALETHWDFGDGTSSDQLMPAHTYATSGIYTVTLTVVTESGCKSSYSAVINIAGANFTASPAYEFRSTTDTDEQTPAAVSLRLFPNPVDAELWLDLDGHPGGPLQWRILDLNGRKLQEGRQDLAAGQQRFSVATGELPGGVYVLQLQHKHGIITRKFVRAGGH